MTPPLDELLARLQRVEAALEAQPTLLAHPLARTPTARIAETPVAPKKREPADERAARTPLPEAAVGSSVVAPFAVLESLDDVVWSVSPDGQLVFFAGGAVERLYGVTTYELHDEAGRWLDALPTEDRARLRGALASLPDAGTFTLEHRIEHASGPRWAVTRGKLVRDRDGRPLRVDGITTDVTRTARTRESVLAILEGTGSATGRAFLAKLARHLASTCLARAALVVEPHPEEPNEALATGAWIDGRSAEPFAHPARGGLLRELLAGGRVLIPHGARERAPTDPLLRHLGADAFAAEPLIDEAGRIFGFVAVAGDRAFVSETDVRAILKALAPRAAVELARAHEERAARADDPRLADVEKRLTEAEERLRGAADLATAGRLAAGAAHDFANLLSVVSGNAELLREALPAGHEYRETAGAIARAATTVAGISRKLLTVARPEPPSVAPLDVASALHSLEPLLRQLTGRGAQFDLELAALPFIRADATQFDRVVLNLVLNARDAIEVKGIGRGSVRVRAAVAEINGDRPNWPAERPPGRYVALTVTDTGCGMSAEVRANMFRAFFTTKGARGTGLGLATVHDAVTAACGHIEVESGPDWGTQIRVYWPAFGEAVAPRAMW